MNNTDDLTCDDAEGFINSLDRARYLRAGAYPERAQKGWDSICPGNPNKYKNARTANRNKIQADKFGINEYGEDGVLLKHHNIIIDDYSPFRKFYKNIKRGADGKIISMEDDPLFISFDYDKSMITARIYLGEKGALLAEKHLSLNNTIFLSAYKYVKFSDNKGGGVQAKMNYDSPNDNTIQRLSFKFIFDKKGKLNNTREVILTRDGKLYEYTVTTLSPGCVLHKDIRGEEPPRVVCISYNLSNEEINLEIKDFSPDSDASAVKNPKRWERYFLLKENWTRQELEENAIWIYDNFMKYLK